MVEVLDMTKQIPCEIWSRTVGFFRPYKAMNNGKQSEVRDRRDLLTKEYIINGERNESTNRQRIYTTKISEY